MRYFMLLVILLVSGCGLLDNNLNSPNTIANLVGNNWSVVSLEGASLLKDTSIDFSISSEGLVKGNSGVNNYFGQWLIDANDVIAKEIASTKMYRSDPKGIMQQEYHYLTLLSSVTKWQLVAEELQFYEDEKLIVTLHNNGEIKSVK